MNHTEKFHKHYSMSVLDAIFTMSIAVQGWRLEIKDLPYPTIKGSKSFLLFAGASDNAVRTAFSRERKKDYLKFFTNKNGDTCFDLNELKLQLTRFYQNESRDITGMTMAVFQFKTTQNKDRYLLKEILRDFGFTMFTQNTYINRKIDHKEITSAIKGNGFEKNLFLFDTELPQGRALKKINELYETAQLKKDLGLFIKRLDAYYSETGDDEDCFNRALYSGAVIHMYARMRLPPLPEDLFPGLIRFNELYQKVNYYFESHLERHLAFYIKQHGG